MNRRRESNLDFLVIVRYETKRVQKLVVSAVRVCHFATRVSG
jgi:hypothetical protein